MSLPNSLWDALNDARKTFAGRVPSEAEAIRILLREALDAREKKAARRKTGQ